MKRVLVTGGSRGIGAACTEIFAKNGYKVYFVFKNNKEQAAKTACLFGAESLMCDVSSYGDVQKMREKIGPVDIIVNNAGISQIKMFQDITENDWDNMFNVNIKGMFNITQHFVQGMISQKFGRIINISSMWGETGGSCEVHYSASKAAVIGFTKSLAKELGPSGITVNCVTPGVIDTEMNGYLGADDMAVLKGETPLERIGTAKDVAKSVLFLASENASFITGAVLPVNGGINI